jgi:iron(III) transport system permease protein
MIPCLIAFIIQRKYTEKKSYYSQGIIKQNIEYTTISPFIKYLLISISTMFIGFFCMKYGFIVIGAFTKQWGYDFSFTLEHFKKVLSREFKPFVNSIKLAIGSGLISSLLGIFLGYLLKSKQLPFRKQIDFLATLPVAVPGILLGIGYLVTFKYPLFGIGKFILKDSKGIILLGTAIIIYIICIFRYMNTGLRTSYALLEHINPNIEQAALNLGATESKVFKDIILPILSPAFFASFYKNLSTIMTTLGAIIFLLLPKNKVAVQQIFQIITSSQMGVASSMAIMLSGITLCLMGLFKLIVGIVRK